MVSAQPSTSTNNRSLKGMEMIVGESIIMPSAIRVEATTRSMIRNGRKIRNPIWNAVFNSLVTKAGNRMEKGISLALAKGRASARSEKSRSEEHTSELQSLMRISYAVFCLKKKKIQKQ